MTESSDQPNLLLMSESELLALSGEALCLDLVALALSGQDAAEVLRVCVSLSAHSSLEVRGVVASCFGHLARLHGDVDLTLASPALERIATDARLKGRVDDAWEDIRRFSGRRNPG